MLVYSYKLQRFYIRYACKVQLTYRNKEYMQKKNNEINAMNTGSGTHSKNKLIQVFVQHSDCTNSH